MLALDTDNRVWSWGLNDKGQLGINTGGYKEQMKQETPIKIDLLENIVKIYCGRFSSFAIDGYSDIYAWGLNKNNSLLINQPDRGLVKLIVESPMLVQLPA